jgi:NAD(P)-dependent dehydrogenase (short-subunit alcohol dehydrogenase family)
LGRVEGKVAVVTGGALGIGRAACLLLAKEGSKVAVADIVDDAGKEVVSDIKSSGGVAQYWHIDVSNEKEVKQAFAEISKKFGNINILVNNAGIAGVNKPTDEIDEREWDAVMNVNAKGVFLCTKHVIPYMKKAGGGSIIDMSSIYGIVGAEDTPPYHASKGAVRLLAKTDALFYAKYKIRVNSVHPAFIWTPLVENVAYTYPEGAEAFKKRIAGLLPIGHFGEPDDVAFGVLYLASDESKFVTGSELVIDGGYIAQ